MIFILCSQSKWNQGYRNQFHHVSPHQSQKEKTNFPSWLQHPSDKTYHLTFTIYWTLPLQQRKFVGIVVLSKDEIINIQCFASQYHNYKKSQFEWNLRSLVFKNVCLLSIRFKKMCKNVIFVYFWYNQTLIKTHSLSQPTTIPIPQNITTFITALMSDEP